MRNNIIKKSLIIILAILIVFSMGICQIALAGMADFDDNDAKLETNRLLEQQGKDEEDTIGKSTNNFLSKLKVEGYKLTPEFDKQTLEYSIESEISTEDINIEAETEDSRAKVNGTGNIKLQSGENNIRIDVEAESGTVRTYFIKVKTNIENKNNTENSITETVDTSIDSIPDTSESHIVEKKNYKGMIITIIIVIIFIVILWATSKSKNKKRKHKHSK